MSKHFVVVTYDIPDNRRRTKLHKRLQDFGAAVQYSVFECLVDDEELARMRRAVKRLIKPRLDSVRYYHLCAACQGKIETTAAGREIVKAEEVYIA